jgi:hypothetical protein
MIGDPKPSLLAAFTLQFEKTGSGWEFRRYGRGAAIPVSDAEHEAFVAAFIRRIRHLSWGLMGSVAILALGMAIAAGIIPGPAPYAAAGVLGAGGFILFMIAWFQTFAAPSAALARRTPVAGALSKDEARERAFSRMSWGQLALVPFAAAVMTIPGRGMNMWVGSGRWFLVAPAALLLLTAVQAFRKWRLERHAEAGTP